MAFYSSISIEFAFDQLAVPGVLDDWRDEQQSSVGVFGNNPAGPS
jgi:hypothetical protein